MKSYRIDNKHPLVHLKPKQAFYGENSLLTIKLSTVPSDKTNKILRFQVVYSDGRGNSWGVPVEFTPPYYFNAVTPDLRNWTGRASPLFTDIAIKPMELGEYNLEVDFNSNLHRNLDPFYKKGIPE